MCRYVQESERRSNTKEKRTSRRSRGEVRKRPDGLETWPAKRDDEPGQRVGLDVREKKIDSSGITRVSLANCHAARAVQPPACRCSRMAFPPGRADMYSVRSGAAPVSGFGRMGRYVIGFLVLLGVAGELVPALATQTGLGYWRKVIAAKHRDQTDKDCQARPGVNEMRMGQAGRQGRVGLAGLGWAQAVAFVHCHHAGQAPSIEWTALQP